MPECDSGNQSYLSDISERDKPWDKHREAAGVVQTIYQGSDFDRYSKRISDCSLRLIFALSAETVDTFRLRLRAAHFCRVRLCPICQWRRSMMWRSRFFKAVPLLAADHPKARYVFLTLTVRNCELGELRSTIREMNKAWERLTHRKVFPAIGWVKSLEVTRNSSNNSAHPHFHALLMVQPSYFSHGYIRQERWRELWQEALRASYLPVVHVKAVQPRPGADKATGLIAGLLETLKYGVKVGDLIADDDWLLEVTKQLHKTRSVALGGLFREYLKESEPEDLITEASQEDEELPEDAPLLYFDWLDYVRRYTKTDPSLPT